MKETFTLNLLTNKFYEDYPQEKYPEIENKPSRPYVVLVVNICGNLFALPLRTNIRHNYCYKFKNTTRETESCTGIDYSKAVIITKIDYIGDAAVIDDDEYVELSSKYFFIIEKFKQYVEKYIEYRTKGGNKYTAQKYAYTTLKYFDKELNIQT